MENRSDVGTRVAAHSDQAHRVKMSNGEFTRKRVPPTRSHADFPSESVTSQRDVRSFPSAAGVHVRRLLRDGVAAFQDDNDRYPTKKLRRITCTAELKQIIVYLQQCLNSFNS